MINPLIGIHAAAGEAGVFAFLWVLVELLNPTTQRIARSKIAALAGTILIFVSWILGGYYYVVFYGSLVKPVIKAGPMSWAHGIIMETKEHLFLFLPFLAILAIGLIYHYKEELLINKRVKLFILLICGLIILIGLSMAGMGYMISAGFRSALESKGL